MITLCNTYGGGGALYEEYSHRVCDLKNRADAREAR